MRVFKATDADMTCHMGCGTFAYQLGVPAAPTVTETTKCGGTGLHACEYVLDCMRYYRLGGGHRFFVAEAAGDIAEDGMNTRIACTELTLIRELTSRDIAREAIRYMVIHPRRDGWQYKDASVCVKKDTAEIHKKDGIAIARGEEPRVKGCAGAHIGWIRELAGQIQDARLMTVQEPLLPDTWYTIEEAEEALRKEKEHEEKTNRGGAA